MTEQKRIPEEAWSEIRRQLDETGSDLYLELTHLDEGVNVKTAKAEKLSTGSEPVEIFFPYDQQTLGLHELIDNKPQ